MESEVQNKKSKVSALLAIGIMIMPYFFSWFTLRRKHTNVARIVSFGWLALMLFITLTGVRESGNEGYGGNGNRIAAVSEGNKKNPKKEEIKFISDTCHKVANVFDMDSQLSDVQKEELWKEFKGQAFSWNLVFVEASEALFGGGYNLQFKCKRSNSFVSDMKVSFPKESRRKILKMAKGKVYKIEGVLRTYNSLLGLSADVL